MIFGLVNVEIQFGYIVSKISLFVQEMLVGGRNQLGFCVEKATLLHCFQLFLYYQNNKIISTIKFTPQSYQNGSVFLEIVKYIQIKVQRRDIILLEF